MNDSKIITKNVVAIVGAIKKSINSREIMPIVNNIPDIIVFVLSFDFIPVIKPTTESINRITINAIMKYHPEIAENILSNIIAHPIINAKIKTTISIKLSTFIF